MLFFVFFFVFFIFFFNFLSLGSSSVPLSELSRVVSRRSLLTRAVLSSGLVPPTRDMIVRGCGGSKEKEEKKDRREERKRHVVVSQEGNDRSRDKEKGGEARESWGGWWGHPSHWLNLLSREDEKRGMI